jgi:hypothetical protein
MQKYLSTNIKMWTKLGPPETTQPSLKRIHFDSRADCSNVDKPGGIPEHNGLSKFGKVIFLF